MIVKTGTVESIEGEYAIIVTEDIQVHDNVATALYRVQTCIKSAELVNFYALNPIGAKVGDMVEFELPVKRLLDASLLEYVFLFLLLLISIAGNIRFLTIIVVVIMVIKIVTRKDTSADDVPRIIKITAGRSG